MMSSAPVVPEAASIIGALVKPNAGDLRGVEGIPKGMSVVMEYKVNSSGEWISFALNPDRWFDLGLFQVVSRK